MQNFSLIQTTTTLRCYQEMLERHLLPLVVRLTDKERCEYQDCFEIYHQHLYHYSDSSLYKNCMFLSSNALRYLIECRKLYVSSFLGIDGDIKYVDYIYKSSSKNEDRIVFRRINRLFPSMQASYSLKKNRVQIVPFQISTQENTAYTTAFLPSQCSSNSEDFYSLCLDALWEEDENTNQKIFSFQKSSR